MASGGWSSSEQSSAPWEAQQPFLQDIYSLAQSLYGRGPRQYGPGRVAPTDPMTTRGQEMAMARAVQGSPLLEQAKGQMQKTMAGDYLGPEGNPWLSGMYDSAAGGMTRNFMQSVMPTLNSRFAMGRTQQDAGQNAQTAAQGRAQGELAGGLMNLGVNLFGGAYGNERNRQMQMAQMAPSMAATDYADPSMMMNLGRQRQADAQLALDDIVARFNFQQAAPAESLAQYSGFIGAPVQTSKGTSSASNFSALWG